MLDATPSAVPPPPSDASILARNLTDLLTKLFESGSSLPEVLDELGTVVSLVKELLDGDKRGFYAGLIRGLREAEQYSERLKDGEFEKKRLAGFCSRLLVPSQTEGPRADSSRVFFESGTTISYLAGQFARDIEALRSKDPPPITAVTNNLHCITALARHVRSVVTTQGCLEYKYFGYLASEDAGTVDNASRVLERANYLAIRAALEFCEQAFLTCSKFSFIQGPLVGSRANCLTKSAIFQGMTKGSDRSFRLCFHLNKMIHLLTPRDSTNKAQEFECHYVFAPLVRTEKEGASAGNWRRFMDSELTKLGCNDFRASEPAIRRDICTLPPPERIPIRTFKLEDTEYPKKCWADWYGTFSGEGEVLIGIPESEDETALKRIQAEVHAANIYFEFLKKRLRYDRAEKVADGVVKVKMSRPPIE